MKLEVEVLTQKHMPESEEVWFPKEIWVCLNQKKGNGCWKSNNRCLLNVGLGQGLYMDLGWGRVFMGKDRHWMLYYLLCYTFWVSFPLVDGLLYTAFYRRSLKKSLLFSGHFPWLFICKLCYLDFSCFKTFGQKGPRLRFWQRGWRSVKYCWSGIKSRELAMVRRSSCIV